MERGAESLGETDREKERHIGLDWNGSRRVTYTLQYRMLPHKSGVKGQR